jgi:hypothetical protein
VTSAWGINDTVNVRNLTWVDYDRDGDLDLHVLAKGDTQGQNEPDLLYRNRTDHFTNEAAQQHLLGPTNGLADACAWEDYDGDGDLDVAILSGSPPRVYTLLETDRLFENDTSPRNQLRVDLQGTQSTRDGMGAWVTCVSPYAGTQTHYVTGNAWRGAQVMLDPYFALRWDTEVDLLRVEWPSGVVTELTNVPAGEITITEDPGALGAGALAVEAPTSLRLAARPTPTTGAVSFQVTGQQGVPATLEIFDPAGRRVFAQDLGATPERVHWSGTDIGGRRVASGVYWAVLREGDRTARTRVVVLR